MPTSNGNDIKGKKASIKRAAHPVLFHSKHGLLYPLLQFETFILIHKAGNLAIHSTDSGPLLQLITLEMNCNKAADYC